MFRRDISERPNWRALAKKYGFGFHTMYGEPYWDETAYYQFNLKQIEDDLEKPTEEIHQMCLDVVDRVVRDEVLLHRFGIPEAMWDLVRQSWQRKDPSLYARLDFAYDGVNPAKLYENNADTPTSLFETGFWQWVWLEDVVDSGRIHQGADQFNILQDYILARFAELSRRQPGQRLYFSCCKDTEEDRATVQYLEDCAKEAGLSTGFVYVEDIGLNDRGEFVDASGREIRWMFKLYPWEFMFGEEYAQHLGSATINWLEPMWKSVLSNKALLPMLWKRHPNHPNLLAAYFADDANASRLENYVIKPLFSREGANIKVVRGGKTQFKTDGPYNEHQAIIQQYQPLPKFGDNYTLIGSWLVNDRAAGISIREDASLITQDLARYLPHIIL
ncbi:glutathionylspermidine synthase family protein [Enterovibrio sp. ZSDZ35]|uniref:Glutathionylspermidine synthase family protein n=1 Tax=Enterovibrio qingdaonensis TaxID=2899818 RepID=A0ABT5QJ31_9GAMM|nr:glutathionylspermidine synthase family protein [Enterovibrio sp. ZSDZ35]MDD1780997.1 glutathionylspermidine synthase family protein [Enterovibrio sp. ZSDZ35]